MTPVWTFLGLFTGLGMLIAGLMGYARNHGRKSYQAEIAEELNAVLVAQRDAERPATVSNAADVISMHRNRH